MLLGQNYLWEESKVNLVVVGEGVIYSGCQVVVIGVSGDGYLCEFD